MSNNSEIDPRWTLFGALGAVRHGCTSGEHWGRKGGGHGAACCAYPAGQDQKGSTCQQTESSGSSFPTNPERTSPSGTAHPGLPLMAPYSSLQSSLVFQVESPRSCCVSPMTAPPRHGTWGTCTSPLIGSPGSFQTKHTSAHTSVTLCEGRTVQWAPMFVDDFDPAAALAATTCPRCRAVGLVETDMDTVCATSQTDRHQAHVIVSPSVPARCPACGLVMDWPGCCGED